MFYEKITLLSNTIFQSLNENDEVKIVATFTELGTEITEASFGFVWLNSSNSRELKLVYKSSNISYTPRKPKKAGRNYKVIESLVPDYVSFIKKRQDRYGISHYMKSFVIIPIAYQKKVYGNIVLCFKKVELFPREKRILCQFIGSSVAQAITIHRLVKSEHKARLLAEKLEIYFKALIENSYEIVTHIDETGKILYVSQTIKKILGVDVKDFVGKNINEFTYTDNCIKKLNYLQKILQNKKIKCVIEFCYKNKDGSKFFLEATSSYISEKVNIRGFAINIRDITLRKKLDRAEEMRRLIEEERFKVEHVADMTHELRTPLAIIKGNVDLGLINSKKGKLSKRTLHAINHEVKHLSNILSDLALLTSQDGQFKNRINHDRLNISELIDHTIERLRRVNPKKNISISTKIRKNIMMIGDKIYLEKLFSNIIRNAITYGKEGGWIRISVLKNKNLILIKVSDNGIGISKEDLPHVFNRFYRVDKAHSSDGKRTGLGLAIAKWVTSVHRGDISVTSTLGNGSVFSIFLPAENK